MKPIQFNKYMALQNYFHVFTECYTIVPASELEAYLNSLTKALEPTWVIEPLTPYAKTYSPCIKIQYKNIETGTSAFNYVIQLAYINGVLNISKIYVETGSDILPKNFNEIANIFAFTANHIKNANWVCQKGIIKLKEIMSDKAIDKLSKFEKENKNKARMMTRSSLICFNEFCEQLNKDRTTSQVAPYWEDILRDCCGFSPENAHDFAMELALE